ncbi:hypothetical protein O181_046846 [Austropuccinia psidii MF-1]|uniref:Uncharacterized protein n=1 Tax=Austropuccinia psidii MF-1 TaxID=1389203 RepID=A0A9Q3HJ07_9BASI|nr:hypothetical protein [Austropuccinia psidii MF-1]
MLKHLNANNNGMNAIGIESDSFQSMQNERETSIVEIKGNLQGEDGKIDDTEVVPPEANGNYPIAAIDNNGVDFGRMGENSRRIIDKTTQKPKAFSLGRRESMCQSSTITLELGLKGWNFANKMNQNMKNMISPLLVLIQHGQEQEEEQDCEIELRLQEAERREEEPKMQAEEKDFRDQLNMVILTVLAKIGSINKDELQLDW